MKIKSFEEMIAWQKAKELTLTIYSLFKGSRNFTLKDQIQRASLSVMNNIAEGFERATDKEFKYFLAVSKGSSGEVRSMLYIALATNEIKQADFDRCYELTLEIGKILSTFMKYLSDYPKT